MSPRRHRLWGALIALAGMSVAAVGAPAPSVAQDVAATTTEPPSTVPPTSTSTTSTTVAGPTSTTRPNDPDASTTTTTAELGPDGPEGLEYDHDALLELLEGYDEAVA